MGVGTISTFSNSGRLDSYKSQTLIASLTSTSSLSLVDINTMMFVAIHELAHIMTKSVGHTPEFWDNMRFLLEEAIKINIYKKQDFSRNPVEYCGTQITDSPL